MDTVLQPYILFAGIAVGALGVFFALPRKGSIANGLGAILAAIGVGVVMVALTLKAGAERPSIFFHIFALIALGASLRVITHRRPVYAALYFILTILSTAGLFLILSAEFLTFALIIIYAGAILITYLFVIMLAAQAPSEDDIVSITAYDSVSREPAAAVVVGFLLLAALTGFMNTGAANIPAPPTGVTANQVLNQLPRKVSRALIRDGVPEGFEIFRLAYLENPKSPTPVQIWTPAAEAPRFKQAFEAAAGGDSELAKYCPPFEIPDQGDRDDPSDDGVIFGLRAAPDDVAGENLERVGLALIGEHPLALELAGIILLMAMVGAVVLARKQIDLSETERIEAARRLQEAA